GDCLGYVLVWRHIAVFFFFSSRRRHTRLVSDWSSDVCSSDLTHANELDRLARDRLHAEGRAATGVTIQLGQDRAGDLEGLIKMRSEERRVGKEGRDRWVADDKKKNRGMKQGDVEGEK